MGGGAKFCVSAPSKIPIVGLVQCVQGGFCSGIGAVLLQTGEEKAVEHGNGASEALLLRTTAQADTRKQARKPAAEERARV